MVKYSSLILNLRDSLYVVGFISMLPHFSATLNIKLLIGLPTA